jgi:hypothetical protein
MLSWKYFLGGLGGKAAVKRSHRFVGTIRLFTVGAFLLTVLHAQHQKGNEAALDIPHTTAPVRLDCSDSGSDWKNIPRVTLSKRDIANLPPDSKLPPVLDARTPIAALVRMYDRSKPVSQLPSPVQSKLDSFQGKYAFQWDQNNLYGYAEIKELNPDSGHPQFSAKEFESSPSEVASSNLFYSTLIVGVAAPSWQSWITEMHIHVRSPKAKPMNAMFFGRTNAEEDFRQLSGHAVACPTNDGWIAKFSVAWLPYDDWQPNTGATANIRILVPLAHEREGYVLASVVPIILTK